VSGSGKGLKGGIVCSLVTPLARDGQPDLDALSTLIEFQIDSGIHGLFLLGTAGEGILLSERERMEVAEHGLGTVAGRVPVAIHCGSPDTATATRLTEHAAAQGADAVAVVAPYYFAYGGDAVMGHFDAIASASPELDLYVYENPERVGYSIPVDVICAMARDIPNVKGVKDTGDTIGRVTRYLASGVPMDVYTGNNLIVYPALMVGAAGSVSALASVVPELFVSIYEAYAGGDLEEARERQMTAARFQSCLDGLPYIGAIKVLLSMRGLPGGHTRAPLPEGEPVAGELEARIAAHDDVAPWVAPQW
jgi:dihydrodipicolinate synthase/N-acetylneuraminate lyase